MAAYKADRLIPRLSAASGTSVVFYPQILPRSSTSSSIAQTGHRPVLGKASLGAFSNLVNGQETALDLAEGRDIKTGSASHLIGSVPQEPLSPQC